MHPPRLEHAVLILLCCLLRELDPMLDHIILRLWTPDLHRAIDSTGGQQAGGRVWLNTVDNVSVAAVHFCYQVRGSFPDVKVPIVGSGDDEIGVVAKEVRLLDVCRCIAVAQETSSIIPCGQAPVLK